MNNVRYSRSVRATLLTSAAGLCLALVPVAHAEINDPTGNDPTAVERPAWQDVVRESQSASDRPVWDDTERVALTRLDNRVAVPEPQIVIANPPAGPGQTPNTTITDRDTVPVTGVGQMVVDSGGGFVGLCTASLINPRTVIFAAHCVNTAPAASYGYGNGGTGISFGFNNNNLPSIQAWLKAIGGSGNTNTGTFLYNSNWVTYNQLSNAPNSGVNAQGTGGFLQADVAVAALDTPAKNVPTWALLFSALPARPINAADGAGYTVGLAGYGNNGTASTGSTGGIDFRRRIAENILGGLASLDQFENFLFGGAATDNPQNLYWIDFDDPRRGTANPPSAFDFNAWRDNATPGRNGGLSQEGITASGDSGGPLILTRIGGVPVAKQLILGVLSGGYRQFFNGQPFNGYGTASFYQPLYLYWDWVAANNPYHYVSSVAGNANWTDPTHWVSNLDPNYIILDSNGNAINGVPGSLGAGTTGNSGTWGQACFQSGGVSDCQDMSTGVETIEAKPIGTEGTGEVPVGVSNGRAIVSIDGLGTPVSQTLDAGGVQREAQAGGSGDSVTANALPAATIDNGLPGATNFVPNNLNGGGAVKPRFFDVTLSATGTTTLDTAVTIDRFGIAGAGAALNITSTGSLTSLMDINQITGTMQVNGTLTSPGDYFMMAGGLNGTGTITVPFFTSVAGTISPGAAGTAGSFGSLTFRGNIVLSSGNTYLVDLGTNGFSDKIVVNRNGAGTGLANLGGRLIFNGSSADLRGGNTYTILTSEGGISGQFLTPTSLSAILLPKLTYTANAVTMTLSTNLYGNVVPMSDPVAFSYALMLDKNRSQAGRYDGLYGPLDLQNAATIKSNLDGLRPAAYTTVQSLGIAGVDQMQGFIHQRLTELDPGSTGGTFARYGAPNQIAAMGLANRSVAGLSGMGFDMSAAADATAPMVEEGALPEGMSAFVAGGYLKGDSASMNGVGGRDDYDGWYVAAGLETWDDNTAIGFTASYSKLDGTGAFLGNNASASLYQGSIYSKIQTKGGLVLDSSITAGLLDGSTRRTVTFVGTPYTLRSNSGSLVVVSEVGLGGDFDLGSIRVTPRVAGRATHIGFSKTNETGGPMALAVDRRPINSLQGRAGLSFTGTGPKVRPFLSGTYVHEFNDRPNVIGANLAGGGIGGNVLFDLNSQDTDYFEVGGGLSVTAGSVDLSVSAETTVARDDVSGQAYRGSISFRF
ncbi:autotransporter domain-containing protein [Sphingomonas sp. LB-2]|uniref:autotransporter domain-containing protein n=1 Tax=Sphingomonas caeni TaxID=2984949 RepID=UPI00222E5F3E|nr:autotransporter domain-containing protein [Sphingomonas caeni]MCW3847304.1 autotransporter domain-containing protein [Sphingomonas caeni]